MAKSPLNKLYSKIFKEDEEEKYSNPYDDGSIWSAPPTSSSSSNTTNTSFNFNNTKNTPMQTVLYNLSKNTNATDSSTDDYLEYARNRMNYYSENIETAGQAVEEPEKKGLVSGALDVLDKLTVVPRSIENFITGAMGGIQEEKTKQQEAIEKTKAFKKLQALGYTTDGSHIYDIQTGKAIRGYNGYDEEWKLFNEIKKELEQTDSKSSGLDYLKSIGKESVNSFLNTYKASFGDTDYSEVSDVSNIYDRARNQNNTMGDIEKKMQSRGIVSSGLQKLGVKEETANSLQGITADIVAGMQLSKITDLGDVGKTIKYLNNSDSIKTAEKIANNSDEAYKLAKEANKYDDFVSTVSNLSEIKKFDMPDESTLKTMYDNFIDNYAQQLMNKTSKTLGGMPDYEGLKLGQWGTVTRETLDNINKSKLQSALLKTGLSIYSPVGGVLNSNTANKITDTITSTKIGSAVKETIEDSFIGGSNNQWVKSAKENPEDALKDINMKMMADNANDVKYSNIRKHLSVAEELKNNTTEEERQNITKIIETPTETKKTYEEVEEEKLNPAVVTELKKAVQNEMDNNTIETGVRKELEKNTKQIATTEKQIQQAIEMESKVKKTVNFKKQLNAQGIDKKVVEKIISDDIFTDSLTLTTNQLSRKLKSLGYEDTTTLSRQIKTASNGVLDTVEEIKPSLTGKFEDMVTIDNRSLAKATNGSNYDTTNIDSIAEPKNKKTMDELLEGYKKETKVDITPTATEGTKRTIKTENETISKEFNTADASRREARRQRILADIKKNNYKLTTSHKALIEGGSEEDLRHYQQLVAQKKQYDSAVKNFKNVNKEYRSFFEKEGIVLSDNIGENLETLALYRMNGETTPILKAGKGGKSSRLLNATTGKYVKPTAKEVESLAKKVSKEELNEVKKVENFIADIYANSAYTDINVKDKVIRELEARGINLTAVEKQSVKEFIDPLDPKDNLNELNKILENKVLAEKKQLLSNLSKDEIQLYKDYLTRDYLDPITEDMVAKVKNETTINWKETNEFTNDDTLFDVGEEFNKRASWNDEAYAKKDAVGYAGTESINPYAREDRAMMLEEEYQAEKEAFQNHLADTGQKELTREEKKRAFVEYMTQKNDKKIEEGLTPTLKKTVTEPTIENKASQANLSPSKIESTNSSTKTVKPLRKASDAIQTISSKDDKITGLKFKLDTGAEIILDEKTTARDVRKLATDNTLATTYVYTKQTDGVSARTFRNDSQVWINVGDAQIKAKDYPNLVSHENFHVIQNTIKDYKITKEQTLEAMNAIKNIDDKQLDNLITIFAEQGLGDTTSRKLLDAGFISKYVASQKGTSKVNIGREANAVIGSLLTSPNKKVRNSAKELFGEDVYNSFMKSVTDMQPQELKKTTNFIRTKYSDELATKMEKLNNISQTLKNRMNINEEAWENNKVLQDILDDLDMDIDNLDYADRVMSRLNEFDDLTGGAGSKAIEGLKTRLTFKQNIEKLEDIDLTKGLNVEEMKAYETVQKAFKDFGLEEELGNMRTNYVTHVLNPSIKADKEAMRIAKDKFGSSFDDVFNVNGIRRKYEGTIEQMNKSFSNAIDEQGIQNIDKKLFLDDIADIYINRAVAHENVMYKKNLQDSFIKNMAEERVVNFQNIVDSEDNATKVINSLIRTYPRVEGAEEISDELVSNLVKDFKGSNRTLYQWLKKEGKDKLQLQQDINNIDIMDLNANDFAKYEVYEKYNLSGIGTNTEGYLTLDDDYVRYNTHLNKQEISENASELYKQKKDMINDLVSKGAPKSAFTDMREKATKEGKVLKTNGDVRIEADQAYINYINSLSAVERQEFLSVPSNRNIWKQNWREERRAFYQNNDTFLFSYTDVQTNWKKVYDGLTDEYMRSNDMILITKRGKNEMKNYNVMANNADDLELTAENFNDYVVSKNIYENTGDTKYMIRKDRWLAYNKQIEEQAIKDKNIFLKAYDKVTQIFKTQALGTGRFVFNTAFGNLFESYFTAGVNLTNPTYIKNYFKYAMGKDINIAGYTNSDIAVFMEKLGANSSQISEEVFANDTYKAIKNATEVQSPLSKLADKISPINPLSSNFALYRATNKATSTIEDMSRFINVTTQLNRGKSFAEAVDITNKALFKYSDLTTFEKNTMKRIIPFYAFMRNNLPLQLNNIMNNPAKYGRLVDVYKQANQQLATEQERNLTPDYMDMYLRTGGNSALKLQIPFDTINSITKPSELLSNVNPLLKTPLELALNYEFYSGSKVSKYGEASDYVNYATQNILPFFSNYGTAISQAKEGNYNKLANLMGVPIQTFELEKQEKIKLYNYLDQLERQWYRIAEENPELAEEVLAYNRGDYDTTSTYNSPLYNIGYQKNSPLYRLLR